MRLARVSKDGKVGLAVRSNGTVRTLYGDAAFADLDAMLEAGGTGLNSAHDRVSSTGEVAEEHSLTFLPPLVRPSKIICLGLNYADHAAEGGFTPPSFPTLFARFPSSLIGHGAPIILPKCSTQLDYEGELVAVIGTGGKHISRDTALKHIAGYSIFNDGSIRDYQMKTPQWTAGKNFDNTGAFGPWFITADELPPGCAGLSLQTRLNGQVMQHATTSDMIFDVAETISLLSSFLTLVAGDVLVMGTPAGIGLARKPPVFMKDGDVVEVEIEKLGVLRNPVVAEE
jgi:2-keto-4-pentenoate hydratase/2-oxohepta-3-ene-1,7-dioic acid hydratase in catechol pathway